MRIKSLNHSTYQHQYHIVWGTKYRRKYLKPYVKQVLLDEMHKISKRHPEISLITLNVDEDHIHMQIEIAPNVSVAKVVQRLKIETSKKLKKEFKFIRRMYLDCRIWSVGYFSSTIGLNETFIKRYIEEQGKVEQVQQSSFGFE